MSMIYIKADYSKQCQTPYALFCRFPYDTRLLAIMKMMPVHFWHPETKEWELSQDCYHPLMQKLTEFGIFYDSNLLTTSLQKLHEDAAKEQAEILQENDEVDISILENVVFPKTQPRDYQLRGIAYGLSHPKYLLADQQGLGKTLQVIQTAILSKKAKHCLIICGIDGLVYNWLEEIQKHSNEEGYILGTRIKKRKGREYIGSMKDRLEDIKNLTEIDPYFIITSITTLRESLSVDIPYIDKKTGEQKVKKDRNYYIANALEQACKDGLIDMVVVDEAQCVKNFTSQQAQAFLRLQTAPKKIAATGTPIMNKHLDVYPILAWLGKTRLNYYAFRNRFCEMGGFKNKQVVGNLNGLELNKLMSTCMLRRKKEDVLDLPDKIFMNEYMDMLPSQRTYYNKVRHMLRDDLKQAKGNRVAILNIILKLRQITSFPGWLNDKYTESAKFDRVLSLVDEIVENGEKAIIFSNWSTPLEKLKDLLASYNPVLITGDIADKRERMKLANEFQTNPDVKVILGTGGTIGVGFTLTAANNVIFLDEPWNRALKDQWTDRAHRIGTTKSVNVYTLMCKNTVDDLFVHKLVVKKGLTADVVVDGMEIEDLEAAVAELLDD